MIRHAAWRALDGSSREHMTLETGADGVTATGVIAGALEDFAFGVHYRIELSGQWRFRRLAIERTDGTSLGLTLDNSGNWFLATGAPLPELAGCIDIDLEGSPFTNTLPIRRARFETDVPRHFLMTYIPFKTLEPFPDGQIYTALDAGSRYRYQAEDGSFEAELSVDGDGLVDRYPPLFEQIER